MEKKASLLSWEGFHFMTCALCVVLLMIPTGNALEYKVGGTQGSWGAPSDPNNANYNQWAEKNRFQIGDTLLFVYDANHDSVLHVAKDDYSNCNIAAPLEKFNDGHTVFKLNQSGPFYFISGVADNCHKNERLVAVVMADRSKDKSRQTVFGPPQSPSLEVPPPSLTPPPVGGEFPPPAGMAVPPPAPAPFGEEPPSPPESTLAPSQESSPPNNGVGTTIINGVGIIAAFIVSTLALVG